MSGLYVIFEAKTPEEVAEFPDLTVAIASGWIWEKKTILYIHANLV
jgi:hypothetical protein